MGYSIALDTACGTSMAIMKDGKLVAESVFLVSGMNNDAALIPWLLERLKENNILPEQVEKWSCGVGPGSYSGVRVGISWVKGICLVSGAKYRGVASSYACACDLFEKNPEAKKVLILHDGRRKQLILSPFYKDEKGNIQNEEARVYDLPEALKQIENTDGVGSIQSDLILPLLPEDLQKRLVAFQTSPAKYLLTDLIAWPETLEEQENSCEPIYVRPAAFVSPKAIRTLN